MILALTLTVNRYDRLALANSYWSSQVRSYLVPSSGKNSRDGTVKRQKTEVFGFANHQRDSGAGQKSIERFRPAEKIKGKR